MYDMEATRTACQAYRSAQHRWLLRPAADMVRQDGGGEDGPRGAPTDVCRGEECGRGDTRSSLDEAVVEVGEKDSANIKGTSKNSPFINLPSEKRIDIYF